MGSRQSADSHASQPNAIKSTNNEHSLKCSCSNMNNQQRVGGRCSSAVETLHLLHVAACCLLLLLAMLQAVSKAVGCCHSCESTRASCSVRLSYCYHNSDLKTSCMCIPDLGVVPLCTAAAASFRMPVAVILFCFMPSRFCTSWHILFMELHGTLLESILLLLFNGTQPLYISLCCPSSSSAVSPAGMAWAMRTTLFGTTAFTSGLDMMAPFTRDTLSSWGTLIRAWLGTPGGVAVVDMTVTALAASLPTARASSPVSMAAAVSWMAAMRALVWVERLNAACRVVAQLLLQLWLQLCCCKRVTNYTREVALLAVLCFMYVTPAQPGGAIALAVPSFAAARLPTSQSQPRHRQHSP